MSRNRFPCNIYSSSSLVIDTPLNDTANYKPCLILVNRETSKIVPHKYSVFDDARVAPHFDPLHSIHEQRQKINEGIPIVFYAQLFRYIEGHLEANDYRLVLVVKHRKTGLLSENYLPVTYHLSEAYNNIYTRRLTDNGNITTKYRMPKNIDTLYSESDSDADEVPGLEDL